MNPIIKQLPKLDKYMEYLQDVKKSSFPIILTGLTDTQKVHFAYSTYVYEKGKICIIASNELIAKNIIKDLKSIQTDKVMFLGKREVVIYDYDVESRENSRNRAYVLSKLAEDKINILVTTIEALVQPVINKNMFLENIIRIKNNDEIDLDNLKNSLINSGYERVEMVEAKGQFAVRGGIVDVFPNNYENGIRIEFWGENVDTIRTFNVINQRTIDTLKNVEIYPADEYILGENRDKIIQNVATKLKKIKVDKLSNKEQEKVFRDIEEIENENYINKTDKYFSYFYEDFSSVLEYLSNNTYIFVDEIDKIEQKLENIKFETEDIIKDLIEKRKCVPNYLENIINAGSILDKLKNRKVIYLSRLEKAPKDINIKGKYSFNCKELTVYNKSMDIFFEEVKREYKNGSTILLLFSNITKAKNISEELNNMGFNSKFYDSMDFIDELEGNNIYITMGFTTNSFEYRDLKLTVISDMEEITVRKKTYKNSTFKASEKIVLADLSPNDYIVHIAYGIGQFVGIDTLNVEGIKKDYVKLKYKDNDMLYVPTNQLDSIRKYIALNDGAPKINKLGTKEWGKAKKKAKESIDNIAKELVELYAARQKVKGFSFLEDNEWQKQFELSFPYQETDDQIRCINEVKKDMENNVPMDRLLCGDVGYGKTEVAIRAAFKAVMSGKQVAYLVPTTILANQQYETFFERMKEYGIRVNVLNRFKKPKEQKDIISKLKLGEIDVVIGTHRLLQKDIGFKDLGLLIIDEEHRFGVKHKETIKELKKNIDVLSMTATPIPRTLHMSIVGIRDMSVIYNPPHNRRPVQTYVLEYDKEIVRNAIIKELEREGQIFYLYNKVEDIEKKAADIQNLLPDAIVEFAHGKMSGDNIENIMYDFINKKIDILVCTTILESGIDIPNANTIIIENAERMGLAQLYQIRGRVGRKDRQAYAYIMYKKNKILSETAEKRLKAIKEFTEFGSGFKIALRDLEIRGAGNILGSEQHGQMEAIGYEMYCKMLEDAVRKLKGEKINDILEIEIDIKISAYIPDSYISNQNQKIEVYQNIALCKNNEDIEEITDELIDRYGEIPKDVLNLLYIAKIKILATTLGIKSVTQRGNNIKFEIFEENNINTEKLFKILKANHLTVILQNNNTIIKKMNEKERGEVISTVINFMEQVVS